MERKPLILLSNDDGVRAKGIHELVRMLRPLANIFVVAPDSDRSAKASSLTPNVPVKIKLIKSEEGLTIYSCTGTPCDCVKLAIDQLLQRQPDMVISGINHGTNASVCVHYSGTVGVAREGALHGIPSIAFSLDDKGENPDFSSMEQQVQHLVKLVLENGIPFGTMLNVNFPVADEYAGIRVTRMGYAFWQNEFTPCHCTGKEHYYWLGGEMVDDEPNEVDTDLWAQNNNYISITPIKVDMTDYNLKNILEDWDL